MQKMRRILNDILSKRDPQGYYVVLYRKDVLEDLKSILTDDIAVEDAGDLVVVRSKSRSAIKELVLRLYEKGFMPVTD